MESSWRHDKQNAIWTLEIGEAMYVASEWEDAIFFPDETSWHDVGLSIENCKRICEWHARIAALEAERDGLQARLAEAEKRNANMGGRVLLCDGCGRLWADDSDSDQESCETCYRFKQRMEWANAQQIEDRDTAMVQQLSAAEAKLARIKAAADADEIDLNTMRDGTKLTRHGVVQSLAFWREEFDEQKKRADAAEAKLAAVRENILSDPASLLPDMVWEEHGQVLYCRTSIGNYCVVKTAHCGASWSFRNGEVTDCDSLDAAKAACDRDRRERVRRLFEGQRA